jgi:hypothetical protein
VGVTGEIVRSAGSGYVRVAEGVVSSDRDVLELFERCFELDSGRILLEQRHLAPEFFELPTGLLGAIFLKLTNYRVRTAIVADLAAIQSERFHEMVGELRRGTQIRFFEDLAEAERWLCG